MDYYKWLNSFVPVFINELQCRLGKGFNYDLNLASKAVRHSEYMRKMGNCFYSPMGLWGGAKAEITVEHFTYDTEAEIKEALKEIVNKLLKSDRYRNYFNSYSNIGCGIAFGQDQQMVKIYLTIRLN